MNSGKRHAIFWAAASAFGLFACQSVGAATPATLANADAETLSRVKTTLARAVNRARVELGPGDFTQSSVIPVLPPPLSANEDRSPATPVIFDIVMEDGECFLVRRDTGEAFVLEGVECRSAAP